MKYKIYSAPGCGRCKRSKLKLLEQGNEVENHTAEFHSLPNVENWRERMDDFAGFKGQLSRQNEELPVIFNDSEKVFLMPDDIDLLLGIKEEY